MPSCMIGQNDYIITKRYVDKTLTDCIVKIGAYILKINNISEANEIYHIVDIERVNIRK